MKVIRKQLTGSANYGLPCRLNIILIPYCESLEWKKEIIQKLVTMDAKNSISAWLEQNAHIFQWPVCLTYSKLQFRNCSTEHRCR